MSHSLCPLSLPLPLLLHRYKLLLQPLRHALLYDTNETIREEAMRAWVGVVSALGEDRRLGHAGPDHPSIIATTITTTHAQPTPHPGEEGGQALGVLGTCPTPGALALLTPSSSGAQRTPGLASISPIVSLQAEGTPEGAAELPHQFTARSGATLHALSIPPVRSWPLPP